MGDSLGFYISGSDVRAWSSSRRRAPMIKAPAGVVGIVAISLQRVVETKMEKTML